MPDPKANLKVVLVDWINWSGLRVSTESNVTIGAPAAGASATNPLNEELLVPKQESDLEDPNPRS